MNTHNLVILDDVLFPKNVSAPNVSSIWNTFTLLNDI